MYTRQRLKNFVEHSHLERTCDLQAVHPPLVAVPVTLQGSAAGAKWLHLVLRADVLGRNFSISVLEKKAPL
ncbi:hypothetical protein NDU88_001497 [Pleurodeles waltl]|uniref:Uncharacterized protein n=1 Tax=Pleurodeles waltl TaxID=8319 RepID=A0AAV7U8N4_PLEWA|nr:hypothetical protein NDU88_001497 [Pleurodeles waltl]